MFCSGVGNSTTVGVGLYSCLCHDDFTPNGDIFIICVHKYINIGTKEFVFGQMVMGRPCILGLPFLPDHKVCKAECFCS